MGKNCIKEVLALNPARLLTVFTSQKDPQDSLIQSLERAGVKMRTVSKRDLAEMVQSESHQGIVAKVSEREFLDLRAFLGGAEDGLVLMLDNIFDPQNFGALLRSADCFGVQAVVFSKNRGCDLTPSVSKASAGASETVPLIQVSNLAETMKKFQDMGYSAVVTTLEEGAVSLPNFSFPSKTLLIVGSEGTGVQVLLQKRADLKLYIPMFGQIDSLNVAQATAVLLSHWKF